jgi:hypothetical protein
MPTPVTELTRAECLRLERATNNGLGWSDGASPGGASIPACFERDRLENQIAQVWRFADESAAERWNSACAEGLAGPCDPIAGIDLAIALLSHGAKAVLACDVARACQDEIHEVISFPLVSAGGSFSVTLRHRFVATAAEQCITQEIVTEVLDASKRVAYSATGARRFDLNEFPESLARQISEKPSRTATMDFR